MYVCIYIYIYIYIHTHTYIYTYRLWCRRAPCGTGGVLTDGIGALRPEPKNLCKLAFLITYFS